MNRCFACNRKTGKYPRLAVTEDHHFGQPNSGQIVHIGSECYKLIGPDGYKPPKGGPRLFRANFKPDGVPKPYDWTNR